MLQSYFFFLTFHTIVEKNLELDLYKNHKTYVFSREHINKCEG